MSDTDAFTMPDDDAPPPPKVKHPDAVPAYVEHNPTMVANLDMTKHEDRRLLRGSANLNPKRAGGRWGGLDDDLRTQAVSALKLALELAVTAQDRREIRECVRVFGALEGQQQADEHLEIKNARLDDGKATENQGIQVTYVNRIHAQD